MITFGQITIEDLESAIDEMSSDQNLGKDDVKKIADGGILAEDVLAALVSFGDISGEKRELVGSDTVGALVLLLIASRQSRKRTTKLMVKSAGYALAFAAFLVIVATVVLTLLGG